MVESFVFGFVESMVLAKTFVVKVPFSLKFFGKRKFYEHTIWLFLSQWREA